MSEIPYPVFKTGELAGTATELQCPNIGCDMVNVKAKSDNAGKVYIGWMTGVAVAGANTSTVVGFELAAGEATGWIPVDNLAKLWRICDNAGDDCTYMLVSRI
jgi:hypothetical protein